MRRRGFTLIELMIVVAVSVILLGAVFAVNFRITDLWRSERVRQPLQQNFRFAVDAMTAEVRQSTKVILPAQNSLADALTFDYIVDPAPHETRRRVTYQRVGSEPGPYHVERSEIQVVDPDGDGNWTETGTKSLVAVTEDIPSLAALHFIHRGSRVITILVAEYVAGGSKRTISYTAQTSVRSLPFFIPSNP